MSIKALITIGFDKHNADFDFSVSSEICGLDVEQMNELRTLIVCAIGTAEDMFRREIERRNPASEIKG